MFEVVGCEKVVHFEAPFPKCRIPPPNQTSMKPKLVSMVKSQKPDFKMGFVS